jgi:4-amino-4-deoxy-L-arabinose transferase-like glycosyltransferase
MMAIVALFLGLSFESARHIAPYVDEAMVFSPARNLLLHGHIGTSIIDPTSELREGMSLRGIDHYTYQIMPFYFLVQAAWYKVVGMGLVQMRTLCALFGILALLAWYQIVKGLTESRGTALFAMALIGADTSFVFAGAFGRCDMVAASFAAMGLAGYIMLRRRRLWLAILVGHTFAAASIFTHPAGMLAAAALVWMPLYLDLPRLRIHYLFLVGLPYLVGAGCWGMYILQAPDIFREQMATNAANRFYGVTQPWLGFWYEIRGRYLEELGLGRTDHGMARLKLILFAAYFLGPILVAITPSLRKRRGVCALLLLSVSNFVIFGLFEGTKQGFYMVHLVPVQIALLAVWIVDVWHDLPRWRLAVAAALAVVVGLHVMRITSFNKKDRMDREYMPVTQFLKQSTSPNQMVMGPCELAFALGFDSNLVDDQWLGRFSGKSPDVIVIDDRYREMFEKMKIRRPEAYGHVTHLLDSVFVKRYDQGGYQVYVRGS